MNHCCVALGSNLGDSVAILQKALLSLQNIPQSVLLKTSSLYQTKPLDCPHAQNDYINAAALLQTQLSPLAFLKQLQKIENDFGRKRPFFNAPRTLDLDLLCYENQVFNTKELILPHPRMHLRLFVLAPLVEIAPDLEIPNRGRAAAWIPAVAMQKIRLLNA